ncbi:hypothetical protein [Rasiella sp. SM2506]|uniref:hypothetical protein n=1 Tax=Rasiella sp. SM2506 TaxID=3423914 RepID=UPI003D7B5961
MKHIYKLLFLVVLLPLSVVANDSKFKGKHTKEKKIHKEYTVNADAGLKINNSYGSVHIVTWSQNKTVIDVIIKTNGNNEDKVSEKLNEITIDFNSTSAMVSAITQFGSKKGTWSSWWGKGNDNVSVEVNYIIKLPATNSVNIHNDYGTVSIDMLKGNASIHCDYGQLIIGELMAENNTLNFDYTQNATIQYMKSGKINADYSEFTLQKAERLHLNADYSTSEIGDVHDLNYNNNHGKISLDKVGKIVGRGDYIQHNIGSVSKSLNINTDYGGVNIDSLLASCEAVLINANYARVTLGLSQGLAFNFELDLNYSSLKGKDLFQYTNTSEDNSSKLYLGFYGKKDSGNILTIKANYGGVTFNKK